MSTRGLYSFTDGTPKSVCYNVYRHSDNYPTGAAEVLTDALQYAWKEPRFEADEFAAAFACAGKLWSHKIAKKYGTSSGGGIRIMPHGMPQRIAEKHCSDIAYRYAIYREKEKIMVQAFEVDIGEHYNEKWLFSCPLSEMKKVTAAIEKANENA